MEKGRSVEKMFPPDWLIGKNLWFIFLIDDWCESANHTGGGDPLGEWSQMVSESKMSKPGRTSQ